MCGSMYGNLNYVLDFRNGTWKTSNLGNYNRTDRAAVLLSGGHTGMIQ
jgi:hypothetical protein